MSLTKRPVSFDFLLKEELKNNLPLVYINENTLLFKQYKIVWRPKLGWVLSKLGGGVIHTFKIKSTALIAASYHIKKAFKNLEEIKLLDSSYAHYVNDIDFYKHGIANTTDELTRDALNSRLDVAITKAKFLKKEIMKHV